MGAWGFGNFENDAALDWLTELEVDGLAAVKIALDSVVGAEDKPGEPNCSNALTAAEVVAALAGRPGTDLPDEVQAWLQGKKIPNAELISEARAAVDAVLADSELKELWAESEDFKSWVAAVKELRARLV